MPPSEPSRLVSDAARGMTAVILAGGRGTYLPEGAEIRPKPMIEIGGKPILWHLMKVFAAHGVVDFVVCAGTKGYVIKEYFANYVLHNSDVTVDLGTDTVTLHQRPREDWRVTVVDTGDDTGTGGRLRRARGFLPADADFLFTYGDSVADVDLAALLAFHRERGTTATMTAVQPPSKYGVVGFRGDDVAAFQEKPVGEGGWINGGFFVLAPRAIDLVPGDEAHWEHEPMRRLIAEKQLSAYLHRGFWHNVDTPRDCALLDELWASGDAPWRIWDGPGR